MGLPQRAGVQASSRPVVLKSSIFGQEAALTSSTYNAPHAAAVCQS